MKTSMMKLGTVLLLIATVFTVGCNQDDIFEEEKEKQEARTLAKRMLNNSGDDLLSGEVYQVEAGSWTGSVRTADGTFTVEARWNRGYSTGLPGRIAKLEATAKSTNNRISNIITKDVCWEGFYGIRGKLIYDVVRLREVNGTIEYTKYDRQECGFNLETRNLRFVDDEGNAVYPPNYY